MDHEQMLTLCEKPKEEQIQELNDIFLYMLDLTEQTDSEIIYKELLLKLNSVEVNG